jgi:hypothetical protein
MPLLVHLSQVIDQVVDMLKEWSEDLGVGEEDIYYGDQERIPRSPTLCVEPAEKSPELYGASRMTKMDITCYVLVYHSEIKNVEENRRNADRLAERIADLLNEDGTFKGGAIHCWVSNIASGYATKQNTTMRASRITFSLTSRELLPNNP